MLIDEIYHEELTTSRTKEAAPERLLRDVSQLFITHLGVDQESLDNLECDVANAVCDMVRAVTENISGRVDLVLLDERSLAEIYEMDSKGREPDLHIVESSSLTGQCIADRKYVLITDTEKASQVVAEALHTYNEFDLRTCKSLLLVPLAYEGEVRAVIRLTNPRGGFFLDAHAKVMQQVELVVLQCLLRIKDRRQRLRISSALEFYTASQFLPGGEHFWSLLMRLPNALSATWGTYWPRVRVQEEDFQALEGIKFTSDDVAAPDDECRIRTGSRAPAGVVGLSHLLYNLNRETNENVFLCLHILQNEANPNFLLRFYSRGFFQSSSNKYVQRVLSDGFHLLEFTKTQIPPWCNTPITLNPNTTKAIHTRIAFVVREKRAVKSVIWLKFDRIHNLDWWERSYIDGLSGIIGRLEDRSDFELALKGFGHFQLALCAQGLGETNELRHIAGNNEDLLNIARGCERAFRFLRNQVDDMRVIRAALQLSTDTNIPEAGAMAVTDEGPIRNFVEDGIELESRGQRGDVYDVHYQPAEIADELVKSVFCSVLYHLVDNAVNSGLNKLSEDSPRKIVIWVREVGADCETIVADSGKELTSDPLKEMFSLEKSRKDDAEHGAGLRVCRILLGEFNGAIKWMSRDKFFSTYRSIMMPDEAHSLNQCNTFFRFTIPKIGD